MTAPEATAYVTRVDGVWRARLDGCDREASADSWRELRAAAVASAGVDVRQLRLVPLLSPPEPLDDSTLQAVRALADQDLSHLIAQPIEQVPYPDIDGDAPAEFVFHASAVQEVDGRWRVRVQGLKDVEVVVANLLDAPEAMAAALGAVWSMEPDTIIVSVPQASPHPRLQPTT